MTLCQYLDIKSLVENRWCLAGAFVNLNLNFDTADHNVAVKSSEY